MAENTQMKNSLINKKYSRKMIDYRYLLRININKKINKLQNIKGLIHPYIGLNRGKCTNTKGILEFIKPFNL